MKLYKKSGIELRQFYQEWKDTEAIVIFGLGIWCKLYIEQIRKDIKISAIIDNNPQLQGKTYEQIPIISLADYLNKKSLGKITVSVYYQEITEQLIEKGLREDIDFCDMNQYISIWYWFQKKQLHLTRVNTSITTKCTLNCRYCNMFMPYYKKTEHFSLQQIKEDFDLLFQRVDKVYAISILGGEPFLHPKLSEILSYIGERYRNRIGELSIITNATLMPTEEILKVIDTYKILLQISNYTQNVSYKKRYHQVIQKLTKQNIPYRIINSDSWLDFGFPKNPWDLKEKEAVFHFADCYPLFRGLNEKRFYFCHVAWSAEKADLYKRIEEDSINLEKLEITEENKFHFLEYSLGYTQKGYLDFCKVCGGCAKKNNNKVEPGEQMGKRVSDNFGKK